MINLYSVLQVRPSCSPDELKSAYRRLARESHPDRQGDAERFQRIQEAYSVLGHAERRALYDRDRRAWIREIGAIECLNCGQPNRVTRRPAESEVVCCSSCKARLPLTLTDVLAAQRQSLAYDAARFVDEFGVDLAELTADALRTGIERLRLRLQRGLMRKIRTLPGDIAKS